MVRLLGLVWKHYKFMILLAVAGILGSALASVKGTLFLQTLIDDYILPLTQAESPDFGPPCVSAR